MLKYIPGNKIGKADSLSRRPDQEVGVEKDNEDETLVKLEWLKVRKTKKVEVIVEGVNLLEKVRWLKVKDNKVVKAVKEMKQAGVKILRDEKQREVDSIIYKEGKVYVPVEGYEGQQKTVELVTRNFWWPGIMKKVKRYVEECDSCQRNKNCTKQPASKLMPNSILEKPQTHILAEGLARLFRDNIWKLHGLPKSIILDRGPQFAAGLIRELNKMLGIESKMSTAFHPQTDGQTDRVNQELKQYLRMFIDHRQEQWPDWLGTAEFVYNGKVYSNKKILSFKANYRQDPRIGFKVRKKGKYKGVGKFVIKMKKIQEKAKIVLGKVQEKINKYVDRKKEKVNEYKVEDLVILSTKDLKYQIVGRRMEKLTERFVGPCKVKKIVLANAIELELPSIISIHLVVNISRIYKYIGQVKG